MLYPKYTNIYKIPGAGAGPGGPAAPWYFGCLRIFLYILDIFRYMFGMLPENCDCHINMLYSKTN